MPTSNRIILTDVDGVLLEWENHFTEWMLQRSYFTDEVMEKLEEAAKIEYSYGEEKAI